LIIPQETRSFTSIINTSFVLVDLPVYMPGTPTT
jgi:hypothetical protein